MITENENIDPVEHLDSLKTGTVNPRFQFSLRCMLVLMLSIGMAFGLLAAERYVLAFFVVVVLAAYGMLLDIIRNRADRRVAVRILVAAIAYALTNVVVVFLAVGIDPWMLFGIPYGFCTVIGCPLLTLLIVVPLSFRKVSWTSLTGFVLWMACIGCANFALIVAASAGV